MYFVFIYYIFMPTHIYANHTAVNFIKMCGINVHGVRIRCTNNKSIGVRD